MALSPDFNTQVADQAFTIYQNAETQMLDKVARRVQRGIKTPGWAERKQAEITQLRIELKKIVKDTNKLATTHISPKLEEAYVTGVKSASKDMGLPDTLLSEINKYNVKIPRSVQRMVLETNRAILGTSLQMLRTAEDGFRKIQAEASMLVLAGVETRAQAGQRMLNMMADQGLTGFIDKAGRKWESATYAEMATRTTTMRAAVQGHIDRQAEMGNDLVIVSSHHAPCPVCEPWEGIVLSIRGNDWEYQALDDAIGNGLFHPNCEHGLSGWFEELSRTTYVSQEERKEKALQYQYTQKQRANERAIRRWKRREVASITPQEQIKAHNKVLHYQSNQRALLKDYESRFGVSTARKYGRESIANRTGIPGKNTLQSWVDIKPRELVQSAKGVVESTKEAVSKKAEQFKEKWLKLTRGKLAGKGKQSVEYLKHADAIDKMYDEMPAKLRELISKIEPKDISDKSKWITSEGAYYQPGSMGGFIQNNMQTDMLGSKGRGAYNTFFHEFGHLIDEKAASKTWLAEQNRVWDIMMKDKLTMAEMQDLVKDIGKFDHLSRNPKFLQAVRKDYDDIIKAAGSGKDDAGRYLQEFQDRMVKEAGVDISSYDNLNYASLSSGPQDMIRGFSVLDGDRKSVWWGHESSYYRSEDDVTSEIFAQLTSSFARPNAVEGRVMLELMPNSSKAYMELIDEALEVIK